MQEVFKRRDDVLLKAASGLAGGIGQMRDVCGSLLGASLMLGTVYGRGREEMSSYDKLQASYVPVGQIYKWFEKEFGSVKCRDIRTRFAGGVYYDTNVPWQKELADKAGISSKCAELVGKTAARAAEMLCEAPAPKAKKK